NDSRGFFTTRVISTFTSEGLAMVGEGISPVSIEQAAQQAGYPVGTLNLIDEIIMETALRIVDATRKAVEAEGGSLPVEPAEQVMRKMVEEVGRPGRAKGQGFFDYKDGTRDGFRTGLADACYVEKEMPFQDMHDLLMYLEAIEAVKCYDEKVIESVAAANIGSIFGIGFPALSGGVLQFVNQWQGGIAGFVKRAEELA